MVGQAAAAAETMRTQAEQLTGVVATFKVGDGRKAAPALQG
jgi:methyl-accepting chemotaxis protein